MAVSWQAKVANRILLTAGESMQTNHETDPMLCKIDVDWMRGFYTVPGDYDDPFLSPLLAENKLLAKLPPTLIHVSGSEVLLDDSRRFAAKAEAAGAGITLEIWDGLPHVWHTFAGLMPEADQAIDGIVGWLE